MAFNINRSNPDAWKEDTARSVAQYNEWFFNAAPDAYRNARAVVQAQVLDLMEKTDHLRNITPSVILSDPSLMETLRQTTAPPIARDRLTGLAQVKRSLLKSLEAGKVPVRTSKVGLNVQVGNMLQVIERLMDRDLIDWLDSPKDPTEKQKVLASVVIGDRKTGAIADPVIRNAQERRQLKAISDWLDARGYEMRPHDHKRPFTEMVPGTYSFRQNFPAIMENGKRVNMPVDAVIQPFDLYPSKLPLLVEAKSAGDFANTNKRRKEEATKLVQIQRAVPEAKLVLFLCGYFEASYLGYSASEGLDWVWEHRLEDFEIAGL
ncbi:XamI family restriction endonuclease [Corynebacterium cystitidis]|uniref:XamI family restriction endonuclease n=1 Tax=Corynebacterium cystitidis TaxID=35757 RepID=UPI00211E5D06|nr:XamI family restriction endonuclease [Corynebacterium cystitidis]